MPGGPRICLEHTARLEGADRCPRNVLACMTGLLYTQCRSLRESTVSIHSDYGPASPCDRPFRSCLLVGNFGPLRSEAQR